jgi:GntR family transcriptional regulator, N-acetylglucosamine utilization regulator
VPTIDKSSPVPYYQQLSDLLRSEIEEQVSRGGAFALPSEHELCERYGITRTTVRHALDILEREGRIYRQRGKGTFVAVRHLQQNITELVSTTEDMRRRGWSVVTRVLSIERLVATDKIRGALGLEPGQPVYKLTRLRVTGDDPISLQTSYLPVPLCPHLEDNDLAESLYRLLESRYSLLMWTAREVLRARRATRAEARALGISAGEPVLYAERVTYVATGEAIEYLEAVWRGDRYDLKVNLTRPQ